MTHDPAGYLDISLGFIDNKVGDMYMDERYMCYCGLYCGNCAVKAKVEPASRVLYTEMKKAGFEDLVDFLPQGKEFWSFLKGLAEDGACLSCREGSGDPGCLIRICAQGKNTEMCALCESYPCEHFEGALAAYPGLKEDNALFRDRGLEEWSALQDERKAKGGAHADEKIV